MTAKERGVRTGDDRRARLREARLYLCVGLRPDLPEFLEAVLAGGVDIVQLREKDADTRTQLDAARIVRRACDRFAALFVVNDRADIALAAEADGVHLGQDDLPPEHARAILGADALVGRSTHASEQLHRALHEPVDYLGVGPVNPTPTKPGRPGVGLEYVRVAAAHATVPWFVTGGMDPQTIPAAKAAGASRFVVVRALTHANDPGRAAAVLRAAIEE